MMDALFNAKEMEWTEEAVFFWHSPENHCNKIKFELRFRQLRLCVSPSSCPYKRALSNSMATHPSSITKSLLTNQHNKTFTKTKNAAKLHAPFPGPTALLHGPGACIRLPDWHSAARKCRVRNF
jgi:hypothetical protein